MAARDADAESDELWLLLHSARNGNLEALEGLLSRLRPRVLLWIQRRMGGVVAGEAVAEDIAQEVLISISRAIATCEARSEAQFMAWVLTIARHALIDWRRASLHARNRTVHASDSCLIADDTVPETSTKVAQLLGEFVLQAQATLSPRTQEVVVQRILYGATWRTAGAVVDTTAGGAKRRWQRAMARLQREILRRIEDIDDGELREEVLRRLGLDVGMGWEGRDHIGREE